MKTERRNGHLWHLYPPPDSSDVIIAVKHDGTREQVTIRGGKAYHWLYEDADRFFCDATDVKEWRGCGGFDF